MLICVRNKGLTFGVFNSNSPHFAVSKQEEQYLIPAVNCGEVYKYVNMAKYQVNI